MLTEQEIEDIADVTLSSGMGRGDLLALAREIEQAATAPLLARIAEMEARRKHWVRIADSRAIQIARLEQAAKRVTDAFKAHGVSTPFTRESDRTRHECEAAMLALDAAMKEQGHA